MSLTGNIGRMWLAGAALLALAPQAGQLAALGIGTRRSQFPYMPRRARRPDPPPVCHATVRAAVSAAARATPLPLYAGGRSFGGRMTSQAQAHEPLPGVRGLIFLAFPLHPAGQPSTNRARHLLEVQVPMLFLQGTRDALAERGLLESLVGQLGKRASLSLVPEADHSFQLPRGSAHSDAQVRLGLWQTLAAWIASLP